MSKLIIVSAPSGTGKTTIVEAALKESNKIMERVITHTTRPIRNQTGEKDGIDYHFVSDLEFAKLKNNNQFLETATIYGNQYGTSKQSVADVIDKGKHAILVIDVQGADNIRLMDLSERVFIFIKPPSFEDLERRLINRGTESSQDLSLRLNNYQFEISQAKFFDIVLTNHDLAATIEDFLKVIKTYQ
ncbi:MAG: guanylate kinase [SAR324 cluster bacterium]|nr:guanylate kinase [SAR324 cluster bacterium]